MAEAHKLNKCLFVTTHYRPLVGGAQMVYDAMASARPNCFSVLTASTDYTSGAKVLGTKAFDDEAPYRIIRVAEARSRLLPPNPSPFSRLRNLFASRRIERQLKRAILEEWARGEYGALCIGALDSLGWLVAEMRQAGIGPIIIYTHGEEISQKAYAEKAEAARRDTLLAADGIVAVSSFTRDLIIQKYGVDEAKVEVITNGVDYRRFEELPTENVRQAMGLGLGPLVLGVGRLVPRKGFDMLLEAWPKIKAAVPSAELAIGGTGPLEATFRERAQAEDMQESVQILGMVPDDMLPSLYASADLFAMPNRTMPDGDTEGFGLVFLEAAAAGTPSVAGRAGGAVDAVIDGETGVLVDGEDPSAIAFAVSELLRDEVRRRNLAKAAYEHARTQGWEAKAQQFLDFVARLREGQ